MRTRFSRGLSSVVVIGLGSLVAVATAHADVGLLEDIVAVSGGKINAGSVKQSQGKSPSPDYIIPDKEIPVVYPVALECATDTGIHEDDQGRLIGACAYLRCLHRKLCGGDGEHEVSDDTCLGIANMIGHYCDFY